jgi:DNA-binding MarR family transcriptional regulator
MTTQPPPERCNCLALRKAARHVSQLYDRHLAPHGLRGTQFSIVAKLANGGPRSINELASELAMDRTTLGRNLLPLERDGIVSLTVDPQDRRGRRLAVTAQGRALLAQARPGWLAAQRQFEASFGAPRATAMRQLLHAVVETGFAADA